MLNFNKFKNWNETDKKLTENKNILTFNRLVNYNGSKFTETMKQKENYKEGEFIKKYRRTKTKKYVFMKVPRIRIPIWILQLSLTTIGAIGLNRLAHAVKDKKRWKIPFYGILAATAMYLHILILKNKYHILREIKLIKPKYHRNLLKIKTAFPFCHYVFSLENLRVAEVKDKKVFPRYSRELFTIIQVNRFTFAIPKKLMKVNNPALYNSFLAGNVDEIKEYFRQM